MKGIFSGVTRKEKWPDLRISPGSSHIPIFISSSLEGGPVLSYRGLAVSLCTPLAYRIAIALLDNP